MKNRIVSRAVVLLIVGAALGGCSGKDKGTNPPAGNLELNSPLLARNATYDHTFATAGTFAYFCTQHTTMAGSVTVQAGSPTTTVNVTISSFVFSPNPAVVGVGGTVHWQNLDSSSHTVTSTGPNP